MKLSLVVPCYNEAENVAAFQEAVIGAFEGCGYDYEIVQKMNHPHDDYNLLVTLKADGNVEKTVS